MNDTNLALKNTNLMIVRDEGDDFRLYEQWLRRNELTEATILSYSRTIRHYFTKYKVLSKTSLLSYKEWLIENNYAPKTINTRINALNSYCTYVNKKALKLRCVKIQQKPFVDNVISFEDYQYFIKKLKEDNDLETYFIVKFIGCTGARVSEVIRMKIEHVYAGHMDIYSKGGKFRRIYFPVRLRNEAIKWFADTGKTEGLIFKNKNGVTIGTTGISYKLKHAAMRYHKLDINCIYPHSFRHMFAYQFLKRKPGADGCMFLSDILGHSSVEITRIYTRASSTEQARIVDKIVDW